MLQRIQSLYLFFANILTGLLYFFPLAHLTARDNSSYQIFLSKIIKTGNPEVLIQDNWLLLGMVILAFVTITITIFQFRNRPRQILFTYSAILLLFLANCILFYYAWNGTIIQDEKFSTNIVAVFPIIAIILLLLAILGIKKDENLVKSIDRIR